jgi:hypothetical protein
MGQQPEAELDAAGSEPELEPEVAEIAAIPNPESRIRVP